MLFTKYHYEMSVLHFCRRFVGMCLEKIMTKCTNETNTLPERLFPGILGSGISSWY